MQHQEWRDGGTKPCRCWQLNMAFSIRSSAARLDTLWTIWGNLPYCRPCSRQQRNRIAKGFQLEMDGIWSSTFRCCNISAFHLSTRRCRSSTSMWSSSTSSSTHRGAWYCYLSMSYFCRWPHFLQRPVPLVLKGSRVENLSSVRGVRYRLLFLEK